MVNLNRLRPLLFFAFAYLIYTVILERKDLSHFVPYNSFEVPKNLTDKEWQTLNDKFGNLIQIVNTTEFSVAFRMDDMISAFVTILNNVGVGKFIVLSVGSSTALSLTDVVVQDVNTLAVTRFKRVDFIVEAVNPFIINKVIITPDKQFVASQNVLPKDNLQPQMFRIQNELHLFYPYRTSDDDMRLTDIDKTLFQQTANEKALQLSSMSTQNPVTAGTVAQVPAMSLPTSSQLDPGIVGAGPLHPIGM